LAVYQSDIDAGYYASGDLFKLGDGIFEHAFRLTDGWGAGPTSRIRRVHVGARGGLDTFSCAGCHSQGGPDGAGPATENAFVQGDGEHLSSANVRNPPNVLGLGLVQALAKEMSDELALQRTNLVQSAIASGKRQTVKLVAKSIDFGTLAANADGTVDTSGVVGVSPDLILRPFGWKGEVARLRRFFEEAARVHFGIQSQPLALGDKDDPDPDHLGHGPWYDPDGDGKGHELEEGALTAGAVYMAMLEVPVILPPSSPELLDRWSRGSVQFDAIGCGSCHTRKLPLLYSQWTELPDTTDGPGYSFNLLVDGDLPRGNNQVELFSDLKRHDMGDDLADPHDSESGIPRSEFLTRPLWGLADTAPYLHDGSATTIDRAIDRHGGEAAAVRKNWRRLTVDEKSDLRVFLLSLTRTPKVRVPR
jgi:hypothetical protein